MQFGKQKKSFCTKNSPSYFLSQLKNLKLREMIVRTPEDGVIIQTPSSIPRSQKKTRQKNEQRNRRIGTRNGHHPTSNTGRHEIKPTSIEGQAQGLSSEDSTIVPARKNVHPSRKRRTRRAPQAKAKPITRCFCHFNKRG